MTALKVVLQLQQKIFEINLAGWLDGRSVGLGCLLADRSTEQLNYQEAGAACGAYGEGGRLVEIINQDQMTFVQTYLAEVEAEWGEPEDGPGFRHSPALSLVGSIEILCSHWLES